jgi:hypothetical protein
LLQGDFEDADRRIENLFGLVKEFSGFLAKPFWADQAIN